MKQKESTGQLAYALSSLSFHSRFSFVFGLIQLVTHGVNHGRTDVGMVQGPLDFAQVAFPPLQLVYGIDLTQGMNSNILWQAKSLGSSFHVMPNGLPRPVLRWVPLTGKHPDRAGLRLELLQEGRSQVDPSALLGLLLGDPELLRKFFSTQGHNVTDTQAGCYADTAN